MPRRHRYEAQPFPVKVSSGSLADEAGIHSGDVLLAVNGIGVGDYLDFYAQVADDFLELELFRKSTETSYIAEIQRVYQKQLGLIPDPDPLEDIVECENRCIFCFIHQQPKGFRRSLFIRDDDYRYSFTHGNFITLTNLTPGDWRRIYSERLSPLNISVHATKPSVRKRMIVHKSAGRIKQQLKSLAAHDISFHTQVVLCPGITDGKELDRTIQDLLKYRPHLLSISVVPAGLTTHRDHLPDLKLFTPDIAEKTIEQIIPWQDYCQKTHGEPIVRLGDEIYWLADKEFPAYSHYGEFEQLEDGIGSCRMFIDVFKQNFRRLPKSIKYKREISVLTGQIGATILTPLIEKVNQRINNLKMNVELINSQFWGNDITVAGLLLGKDLLEACSHLSLGDEVWIPEIMVRNDEQKFLDDMTVKEFEQQLNKPVRVVPEFAESLVNEVCLLA